MAAYRRSIAAKSKLFYQQQQQPRFAPSSSHISCGTGTGSSRDREELPPKSISPNSEYPSPFLRYNAAYSMLSGTRSNIPAGYGLIFCRNFSKVPPRVIDGGDLNGVIGDVGNKAVEAAAVVNEVAVAAADSTPPVAALQYLIDYVHCGTGFQWWASIVATTFLIRFVQLPCVIKELKHNQEMKEIRDAERNNVPVDSKERLIKCLNVLLAFPLFPVLLNPISSTFLFFAILNMALKVPSFATGGTLWFMDLTSPDHTMRLPVLCGLTLWLRLKFGVGQDPPPPKIYMIAAGGLISAVALGAPSALYLSWITSNLFPVAYAIALMNPRVSKFWGLTMKPPSTPK